MVQKTQKASNKPLDDYFHFVGWFIKQFAELEFSLRSYLLAYSGMDQSRFDVLVGFPNVQETIKKLKELLKQASLSDDDDKAIKDAFDQLDTIIQLRNRIVHFGGNPIENGQFLIRTKRLKASKATGECYDLFEKKDLWNAALDLQLIQNILSYRLGTIRSLNEEFPDEGLHEAMRQSCIRKKPWKYVPNKT